MMGAHGSFDAEADILWLLHVVTQNIKGGIPVYLFWIGNWGSLCMSSWPSNRPMPAEYVTQPLCCVVEEPKEAERTKCPSVVHY